MNSERGNLVITGLGVISAIGNNATEVLASCRQNKTGVGKVKYLHTSHDEFPVGEVKMSNEEMVAALGLPLDGTYTRTFLMGALALKEAVAQAQLSASDIRTCGFISGTTVGGMDKSEQYYQDFLTSDAHKEYISTHDCGICSEMIAAQCGSFAFVTTVSTACSSAANAIILAANLIESGQCDVVVAGGSECITKYHLNGFNTLRILDTALCRPFDDSRAGINLGEGASFLVIERRDHAERRGAEPLCRLQGWGNACDAFHQTATSEQGDGAYLAMEKALAMAGLRPADIVYVNAHGTGTPNNDITETNALKRVFGKEMPYVSSTKAFTGHTTSASGSIELAICILAMQNAFVPVSLNQSTDMPDGISPARERHEGVRLSNVMCNAFGFGGNDSSIIISEP